MINVLTRTEGNNQGFFLEQTYVRDAALKII